MRWHVAAVVRTKRFKLCRFFTLVLAGLSVNLSHIGTTLSHRVEWCVESDTSVCVDGAAGSSLQSMLDAVDNADVILVCLSRNYKHSPRCRTGQNISQQCLLHFRFKHNILSCSWSKTCYAHTLRWAMYPLSVIAFPFRSFTFPPSISSRPFLCSPRVTKEGFTVLTVRVRDIIKAPLVLTGRSN